MFYLCHVEELGWIGNIFDCNQGSCDLKPRIGCTVVSLASILVGFAIAKDLITFDCFTAN